jgi:hypothetical protein
VAALLALRRVEPEVCALAAGRAAARTDELKIPPGCRLSQCEISKSRPARGIITTPSTTRAADWVSAVENLLANRFCRRDPAAEKEEGEPKKPAAEPTDK